MLNLKVLEDYILESRRQHSSLPKEIATLILKDYELLSDPIETSDSTIYLLKKLKETT